MLKDAARFTDDHTKLESDRPEMGHNTGANVRFHCAKNLILSLMIVSLRVRHTNIPNISSDIATDHRQVTLFALVRDVAPDKRKRS